MIGAFALKNLVLIPVQDAVVSVDDINFSYGYGVYETLKVRGGVLYFPELHTDRLLRSAQVLALHVPFSHGELVGGLKKLVRENKVRDANLKVLLIGNSEPSGADLYAMLLNPLFPKRTYYRDGCDALLFEGERILPQAKTLNMLMSSMAYKKAQSFGCYDALFENPDGVITEGTRTNLFWVQAGKLFTSPLSKVLEGVTLHTLLDCFKQNGLVCEQAELTRQRLESCEGLMLSSTSTKLMPIARVLDMTGRCLQSLGLPSQIHEWIHWYDTYLKSYAESQELLVPS